MISTSEHDPVLRGLWRAAAAGRLPHALLFHGPEGIGKFAAGLRLVQGLLCAQASPAGPCEACGPCKRLRSGQHPDLFVIDVLHEDVPVKERQERIRIERIVRREGSDWDGPVVEDFLSLRSAEGGWRALIVRDAERLAHSQNEAQNALLKVLEEPGRNVLWVLVSARPGSLLPTLRSRCVPVRLDPLDEGAVESAVRDAAGSPPRARRLARWAQGSPGRARDLAARGALEQRALLEEVWGGTLAPLAAAARAWDLEGEFRGKTPSARERDRARALVDLALEVVSDALRAQAGAPSAGLAHGDLFENQGDPDATRLREALEELLAARADLELNLDAQGVLDQALLAVAHAGGGGTP